MTTTGLTGDLFAATAIDAGNESLGATLRARPTPAGRSARRPPPQPVSPQPALPQPALPQPAPRAARQLWVALSLPGLALPPEAARDTPVVVVEDVRGRQVVMACNGRAARLGIGPGIGLETALALAPELHVTERVPALEARRLEELAWLATGFTPLVCVDPPDGLLLEVRGSCRLFGGLEALLARLGRELDARHCAASLGVAPTPRAATWFARGGDARPVESPAHLRGRLNALPLAVTRWPEATLGQLARLGLKSLGDLVRLPRAGLAQRFTMPLLFELDEAYGRRPAVRRHYRRPERFATRLELEAEIENQALLEPALHGLLAELGRFVEARAAGVAACTIHFEHRARPATRITLRRGEPGGAGEAWHRLLYERLARLTLPAPVTALNLRSGVVLPLRARSALLPGLADPAALTAEAGWLIDRLRARLGESAVAGLKLVEGHRPEASTRQVPPALGARRPEPAPGARLKVRRPLWLLTRPEPLGLRNGRPWLEGELVLESGPERIESGWWDGGDVCRDYYVARQAGGARLWVFRELREPYGHWFWHGAYA